MAARKHETDTIDYSFPRAMWDLHLDRATRVYLETANGYRHRASLSGANPFDAGLMAVYMQGVVDGMDAAQYAAKKAGELPEPAPAPWERDDAAVTN